MLAWRMTALFSTFRRLIQEVAWWIHYTFHHSCLNIDRTVIKIFTQHLKCERGSSFSLHCLHNPNISIWQWQLIKNPERRLYWAMRCTRKPRGRLLKSLNIMSEGISLVIRCSILSTPVEGRIANPLKKPGQKDNFNESPTMLFCFSLPVNFQTWSVHHI